MKMYSFMFFTLAFISGCFSFLLENVLNLSFVSLSGLDFLVLSFIFDFYSLSFMSVVFLISSCIMYYSLTYMDNEAYLKRFFMLMVLFITSMIILISSGNLLTAMIGWDGLGLSSFLLILHYHSPSSLKASMMTFLCNRVGDVFLIISICLISLMMIYPNSLCSLPFSSLLICVAITKSAQIPFSAWLPAAMAAPTPVSSLVHSSTLVTAGIYLLFRFHSMWESSVNTKVVLSILSICTLLMASFCALNQWDLKKVIAFSTLSQLGMMMFTLSMGLLNITFFHLITHAFSKALLFMAAGSLIHFSTDNQDMRLVQIEKSPILSFVMLFSNLSLCGFPFLSGFYSKDLIIDKIIGNNNSVLFILLFTLSLSLTTLYSFRMIKSVLYIPSVKWRCLMNDSSLMIKPILVMMIFSSFSGATLSWYFNDFSTSMLAEKIAILLIIFVSPLIVWYVPLKLDSFFFLSEIWFISSIYSSFSSSYFYMMKYFYAVDSPGTLSSIHNGLKSLLFSFPMSKKIYLTKIMEFSFIMTILFNQNLIQFFC